MEVTKALVDFIVATRYSDLPKRAVELAKYSFLDTVGIALAGSIEPGTKILSGFIRESKCSSVASLVGQRVKSNAQMAALANGVAADILGFSDASVYSKNHPSAAICPVLWALGEQYGLTGKDIILSHVVGVEVGDKIGAGIRPHFQEKGWHPLPVLGTFGATVAAGKLLNLDSTKMANALGIAGEQASGIKASMGTMSKAYGGGRAAENGVVAAKLAQAGFTGPADVFERRDGILQTFGDGADGRRILENLGSPFEFISPGITLKKYPSCTRAHTVIKGLFKLREECKISPENVGWITCRVTPAMADVLKFSSPQNKFEAKYSLQYCVAIALMDGKVTVTSFSDERVRDRKILELMKRIEMIVSEESAARSKCAETSPYECMVTIKLKTGKEISCEVNKVPWGPDEAPTWDELVEKYRSCSELILSTDAIDETLEIIFNLEKSQNIYRLMDILRG